MSTRRRPARRSDIRGLGTAAVVAACVTALSAAAAPVTQAAPAVPAPPAATVDPTIPAEPVQPSRPTDHPMGSQIARHEGRAGTGPVTRSADARHQVLGMDVSHWQGRVNWPRARKHGARFAYVKATEGIHYRDPTFTYQYRGSRRAGLLRGAYHFALPHESTGTAQATYFVRHGGGWARGGHTLPGALDIEYNPYGRPCYKKNHRQMAAWITGFSRQYRRLTHRWPVIYTSTSWWAQCVGKARNFSHTSPLWIARYHRHIGALPFRWGTHTIWQHDNEGRFPGDQNRFNGSFTRLRALAAGRR